MATSKSQKKALKKLEDQLTCAICLDAFKDPKLLQCFHVYCKGCLERLVVQDQQGQVSVSCPTCRRSTLLPPPSTVADLQSAFHIHHLFDIRDAFDKVKEPEKVQCGLCTKVARTATSYCRDCGEFICAGCVDTHANWAALSKHEVVALDSFEKKVKQLDALKKVALYCSLHEGKELELYCETCEELICHNCTVKKHCRPEHQYDLVTDVFDQQKAEIVASLEPVNVHLEATNKAIEEVDSQSKAVKANIAAVEADIDKEIDKLQGVLEMRRAELKANVKEVGQEKLKNLATQKEEIETVQTQLVSCLSVVQESLRTGSKGEVMKMKKGVTQQIKEITDAIKPDQLSPCESPDITFTASPELAKSCKLFGLLRTGKISAKDSYATGKGLKVAVRGEKATAVVHVCDKEGRVYPKPVKSLTCELTADTSADKVKGEVKKTQDGQYEISYHAPSRGRHQLHIKVEGDHIKGSPFPVIVKLPVRELGTPVKTIDGFNKPLGVAINQRGEILVTEYSGNCVSIFSSTGQKIRPFGSKSSRQVQFDRPCGITVDDDQNILVADNRNHRIQKFSSDGRFIAAVGTPGDGQLQFGCPVGIKINPRSKRIYVADLCNNRIQVLQPDLSFFSSFGSQGSGPGQLFFPWDVAFDSANNVYVTDYYNNRVQVFTEKGEYLQQIGKKGTGKGELAGPAMITIDDEDRVFVTSSHRVSVFTSHGDCLTYFGTQGNGPQQFCSPHGISIDKTGMLYVCDFDNKRVQIF